MMERLNLFLLWIMLGIGNFVWATFNAATFADAAERTFFQGTAIASVALVERLRFREGR